MFTALDSIFYLIHAYEDIATTCFDEISLENKVKSNEIGYCYTVSLRFQFHWYAKQSKNSEQSCNFLLRNKGKSIFSSIY